MSKIITLSSIKPTGTSAVLDKRKDGAYLLNLGAINVMNSAGNFYTADEEVKQLFTDTNSTLMRRLNSGYVKSEVGHPKPTPGMSKDEFFSRCMRIDEKNICATIAELQLVDTGKLSELPNHGNLYQVRGWVVPSGVHGEALKNDLDNENINVAFSVRSFTQDTYVGGILYKKILQIVTYDWVYEPGISSASKWKTAGIESVDLCTMELEDIKRNGQANHYGSMENTIEKDMVAELVTNANKKQVRTAIIW